MAKRAKALPPVHDGIRIVDRGDWVFVRIPLDKVGHDDRRVLADFIKRRPFHQRRWCGAIEAWAIKSEWLDDLRKLIEDTTGKRVLVEG